MRAYFFLLLFVVGGLSTGCGGSKYRVVSSPSKESKATQRHSKQKHAKMTRNAKHSHSHSQSADQQQRRRHTHRDEGRQWDESEQRQVRRDRQAAQDWDEETGHDFKKEFKDDDYDYHRRHNVAQIFSEDGEPRWRPERGEDGLGYRDPNTQADLELPQEYFKPFNPKDYVVSVGDILEISIFGQPDTFVEAIPVAPDGRLYYDFTGGIEAHGRTLDDIRLEIEHKIKGMFTNPVVSIIPIHVTSSSYVILGKVRFPGEYSIESSMTILQAIGEAGGFEEGGYRGTSINVASMDKSFIVREGRKLPIDFRELMTAEGGKEYNIFVRPGDYIYIASLLNDEVYRLGEVTEERAVTYRDGMTLVGLITGYAGSTGGWTPEADLNRVLIIRGRLDDPHVTRVNLEAILNGAANDIYLMPGDIVYVSPRKYPWLRDLVKLAITTFVRSFAGNAGDFYTDERWIR